MNLNIWRAGFALLIAVSSAFAQNSSQPIKAGDTAPDFTLSDHNGQSVQLSAAVENAPVVLVFYRGYWCPFCGNQLSELRGLLRETEKTRIFAVSVDGAEKSKDLIKKIEKDGKGKVNYVLLSDPAAKTIDGYGLRDPRYTGEKVDGIPYPTVYVVTKNRKIAWAKLDKDYKQRPTNAEIRAELDKLK